MPELHQTIFFDQHVSLNAKMVEFGGWEMPIQYPEGIITEHVNCRKTAGIFDVSHMGRLIFSGNQALEFLQHVLTNNAAALEVGESQYTLIQNEAGGAIDDAYLYRFREDDYLLVVNASNRLKDIEHFETMLIQFPEARMTDHTFEMAMISLQGPESKAILDPMITKGALPDPARNQLSVVDIDHQEVWLARTGYTGEPIGFELFIGNDAACGIWDLLIEKGACPVGLGARDTLRLEACLPLYGHELGMDTGKQEIPIFASKLSKFAVSFSPLKSEFIGKPALEKQYLALKRIIDRDYSDLSGLPRMVMPLAVTGKGIAREGYKVFKKDEEVGYITSGTMVPFLEAEGSGLMGEFGDAPQRRAIALALVDSSIQEGDLLDIEIRNKRVSAVVVPYHMSSEAPPFVRAIPHDKIKLGAAAPDSSAIKQKAKTLLDKTLANQVWRQTECINLIPSEMSQSYLSRVLSIADPVNRYAEHKEIKAFSGEDVFYYQGTDFIDEVEHLLNQEFQTFFNCAHVESRVISGQMANTAVFSALVDFLNRADRKSEQRRIRKIINNHIIRGGHLSAQPMGALRDFVARDPKTERPAVINFPVLAHNPYKIDVNACEDIIKAHQPELIIFGKSMILHKEPVAEIRRLVDAYAPSCLIMYDMAHVLGLYGEHFQSALQEGADIITGSTHKTYFGTQRGVIAADFAEDDLLFEFWDAVKRRTFPGSVSNHHLGTMTGLLFSAYEMNCFKDEYQKAVIKNAKAFAAALKDEGLDVAGDPQISFTETHQVILNVGYGKGAAVATELEANGVIVNYQATPAEEGFTASGALRMGVSEMTRFGMGPDDFKTLAGYMADLILRGTPVKEKIASFRKGFRDMQYCFKPEDFEQVAQSLIQAL